MLKIGYIEVGTKEVPDMISLVIGFTGCPVRCPDCHSKEYWDPKSGKEFPITHIEKILKRHRPLCDVVCFMGGEWDEDELLMYNTLAEEYDYKTALYTGMSYEEFMRSSLKYGFFNYVKVGPYSSKYGRIDEPTSNQKFLKLNDLESEYEDITHVFRNLMDFTTIKI